MTASTDKTNLNIDNEIDRLDDRIERSLPMREAMRQLTWYAFGTTVIGAVLLTVQFRLGLLCLGPGGMALLVILVWRGLLEAEARWFELQVRKLIAQKKAHNDTLK